jgi:penicillin-insensitive murein endopeptidase
MVSDLPNACSAVLAAPSVSSVHAATYGGASAAEALTVAPASEPSVAPDGALPATGPIPDDKPPVQ